MRFPFPLWRTSSSAHLRTCRGSVRAGLFGAGLCAALIASPSAQSHFRTGIDLVALNVTVLDPQGRPIRGLTRPDFLVYEDGVKQDVSYFASNELPTDLVLLIDTSTSMRERMPFVRKTAAHFAHALRPGDRGAVFDFNTHIAIRQPLTDDLDALTRVIASTEVGGSTAMYDAIQIALRQMPRQPDAQGRVRRQLIVVLSDGDDNASVTTFDMLREAIDRSGVTIYTIAPQEPGPDDGIQVYPRGKARRGPPLNYAMTWLARETGGVSYTPMSDDELADAYQRIGDEMADQYLLGYVSSNRPAPGVYRRINIQTMRPAGSRPRVRVGYLQ